MVNNIDRAEWAGMALTVFAARCSGGGVGIEALTDLVTDIGHFGQIELGLSKLQVIDLFQVAVGAWISEADHPEEDPWDNHLVKVEISSK